MLNLSDERWSGLTGGYKVAYDPRQALGALAKHYSDNAAWDDSGTNCIIRGTSARRPMRLFPSWSASQLNIIPHTGRFTVWPRRSKKPGWSFGEIPHFLDG